MRFLKNSISLLVLLTLFACKNDSADKAVVTTTCKNMMPDKKQMTPEGKIKTASMHIEGMSCAVMCAAKIEKELASMPGVQSAKVNFENKTATVEYDDAKQSAEKLSAKVESVAGGKLYKVSVVKSNG